MYEKYTLDAIPSHNARSINITWTSFYIACFIINQIFFQPPLLGSILKPMYEKTRGSPWSGSYLILGNWWSCKKRRNKVPTFIGNLLLLVMYTDTLKCVRALVASVLFVLQFLFYTISVSALFSEFNANNHLTLSFPVCIFHPYTSKSLQNNAQHGNINFTMFFML